jgi:bifunctional NMN adenylyltransferase/nudix hydrolase
MTTKLLDFAVFIGRMRPVHLAHMKIIEEALEKADKLVILVGSANRPRSFVVSAFEYAEVLAMLTLLYKHHIASGRLVVMPLDDFVYDHDGWQLNTTRVVNAVVRRTLALEGRRDVDLHSLKVGLAGFGKDASSYYLNMFPEWESIQVGKQFALLSATAVRDAYFQRIPQLSDFALDPRIIEYLRDFMHTDEFAYVVREREAIEKNIREYGRGPFSASDAVITWRDHVLLVNRDGRVGYGLDAFPGGMLECGETTLQCAFRELNEETRVLDLNPGFQQTLMNSMAGYRLFDAPDRDPRGHYMSHAYHFALPDDFDATSLRMEPRSDARAVRLVPISEWGHKKAFLEHFAILRKFVPANDDVAATAGEFKAAA